MEIEILELSEGARKARGLTVIIDVFRAFSTSCYLFDAGVCKIIAVDEIGLARKLKKENRDYVLIGERGGEKLSGFDYGNSPSRVKGEELSNKTVVLTTSAGTRGLVNAFQSGQSGQIITGSFVNDGAIVKYINKQAPDCLSLIAMGIGGKKRAAEDLFCARYLKNKLLQQKQDISFTSMKEKLKQGSGQRFFDNNYPGSHPEDFELCLLKDKFNFIIKAVDYCPQKKTVVLKKTQAEKEEK